MLNVGDVIWRSSEFGSVISYEVRKIMRVTAKQAVVNDSLRLYREVCVDFHNSKCYRAVGRGYYYLMTDEVSKKIVEKNKMDKIKKWFGERQFTDEELEKIYILLNSDEKF
jgi:hypothetical protein